MSYYIDFGKTTSSFETKLEMQRITQNHFMIKKHQSLSTIISLCQELLESYIDEESYQKFLTTKSVQNTE